MTKLLTQKDLIYAAKEMGAKKEAIKKWQQRRLPDGWRIKLANFHDISVNEILKIWHS